ncbi:MAG: serine/threonine protein kinase, partial [Planctomycetaceae bacterium]|nr:serine/threonine protein kinase [Planctomycetaceae bacterium]
MTVETDQQPVPEAADQLVGIPGAALAEGGRIHGAGWTHTGLKPRASRLFTHFFVIVLITVVGICSSWLFHINAVRHNFTSHPLAEFLSQNLSAIIIGFGLASYGCIVSERMKREMQDRRQLGPYRLHHRLGAGGMGDVYLAEHSLMKRLCAIKVVRRDRATDRKTLIRFEREVRATAALTHWNTVQIYDYGCTSSGTFYYAMEYLEGMNLWQVVEKFGPLPPARVVYILRQLCHALHEAAEHDLVHRDIKPSNIFLAERGEMFDVVKLLDFGLVKPTRLGKSLVQSTRKRIKGSPRFMCPEQAQGQEPDCRGDLYSLACVAYYLLTGRPPFEDENPVMLVMNHATVPVPSLSSLGTAIPADLEAVVMKCLRKKPNDRYCSPRELLTALESCACAYDWSWQHAEQWW